MCCLSFVVVMTEVSSVMSRVLFVFFSRTACYQSERQRESIDR